MSIRRLVTWVAFLAVLAMAAKPSLDTDTWWHLRAGQWMIEHHQILQVDLFSYTRAGEAWRYPGWLVEAPMAWIYATLGPGGLNLWTAGMVTLAFAFVWRTMTGGPFLRAFVLILAAAASGLYWAARPYLMTFLLAAVFVWILEEYRWRHSPAAQKRLLWLPLLMMIWTNSHGGFVVGFLLWSVYLVGEGVAWVEAASRNLNSRRIQPPGEKPRKALGSPFAIRQYLWIGLLMLVAACLNPSGPVILFYPFRTAGIGALQAYIQEWQPPDLQSWQVQPFIWLLLLTLITMGVSRRRLAMTDFLLSTGFACLALIAGRNVALFSLVAPAVLTRYVAPALEVAARRWGIIPTGLDRRSGALSVLNTTLLVLIFLLAGVRFFQALSLEANERAYGESLPVEAMKYLRNEMPRGRLFNSYNWGGYILWALPEYPVFVDGRTDLYDDEIIIQWLQVVQAQEGWQAVLDRWGVNLILLEKEQPVIERLAGEGWRQLYKDDLAVIYSRCRKIDCR